MAITRQSLDGVVVDNQSFQDTWDGKVEHFNAGHRCCSGTLKIVKPTLDGLLLALGPSHS